MTVISLPSRSDFDAVFKSPDAKASNRDFLVLAKHPNNDGFNDTWNIIGLADYDPAARIYIFDRYGKLLKQISPRWPAFLVRMPLPQDCHG